jgi:hypothetical protein
MANGSISYNDKMFDRNHASKIFVANNYGLSPKYGWLFHVAFDLNPEISRVSNDDLLRMGFVVKSTSLPKFSVDTKVLNAYNRVDVVQSKVKYDTITIKFHDDNLDVVRNFWYDYYSYYYRDADWNLNIYQAASKYNERQNQSWGYAPRQFPASSPATQQYISAIRIYSLHNKRFAEYTIINPIITSFQHGEHAQGGDAGTLENSMTIQYQAVKYQYGDVSPDTVSGFASLQYDSRPSPMGTTPARDTTVHDLSEGASGLGGIMNNFKNLKGGAIIGGALSVAGSGLISSALNGTLGGKISAAAGAAADKLKAGASALKDKLGISQDGLPNDSQRIISVVDVQDRIDTLQVRIAGNQQDLETAESELGDVLSETEQLMAQIESDTEQLLNPDLSSEDLSALQSLIDENQSRLDDLTSKSDELESSINELTASINDDLAEMDRLQEAQNPSGNSEEEGGAGAGSVTEFSEDGSSTTTNPDGSTTSVDPLGNIFTTPQANPVDNPNASTNQKVPVFKLSETSNPSNFRA